MNPHATDFLTIREAADFARVSPKRLRNLMASGILKEGVHFSRPRGMGPRFRREALLDWMDPSRVQREAPIPMARGYEAALALRRQGQ